AVQQRLDRRPHAAGILQRVGEIADHLLIAHILPLEQRPDVVHPHAGEVLALDGFEVGAAALHAQHGDLTPAVIALDGLDGRIAAAPDDQRGLGTDEPRGVDEEVEALERRGLGVVPARLHRALTISQRAKTQGAREARPRLVRLVRRRDRCYRTPYTWMRSPPVAGASVCTVPAGDAGAAPLKPLPPPKIVPHSLFVL